MFFTQLLKAAALERAQTNPIPEHSLAYLYKTAASGKQVTKAVKGVVNRATSPRVGKPKTKAKPKKAPNVETPMIGQFGAATGAPELTPAQLRGLQSQVSDQAYEISRLNTELTRARRQAAGQKGNSARARNRNVQLTEDLNAARGESAQRTQMLKEKMRQKVNTDKLNNQLTAKNKQLTTNLAEQTRKTRLAKRLGIAGTGAGFGTALLVGAAGNGSDKSQAPASPQVGATPAPAPAPAPRPKTPSPAAQKAQAMNDALEALRQRLGTD